MVKNCDRGAFSRPRSQFFTIWTDPKSANNIIIYFSCSKLVLQPITNGFVYATLSLNREEHHLLTKCKKSSQRRSNSDTRERCIKEQIFFDLLYVSCIDVFPV